MPSKKKYSAKISRRMILIGTNDLNLPACIWLDCNRWWEKHGFGGPVMFFQANKNQFAGDADLIMADVKTFEILTPKYTLELSDEEVRQIKEFVLEHADSIIKLANREFCGYSLSNFFDDVEKREKIARKRERIARLHENMRRNTKDPNIFIVSEDIEEDADDIRIRHENGIYYRNERICLWDCGKWSKTVTAELTGDGTLTIRGAGKMWWKITDSDTEQFGGDVPWYHYQKYITSIIIENGVKNIDHAAFINCENLTSCIIPDSVTTIGRYAFAGCKKLADIHIPNGVKAIQTGAFWRCESLTSVVIPNAVQIIDGDAFRDCAALTSIAIPNGVKVIGDTAFCDCRNLKSVTISNSVTKIDYGAFSDNVGLMSIDIAEDNAHFCSVDGVLFNKDKTLLILYPGGRQGAYTIPDGVLTVEEWAFSDCRGLTSLSIPNSVTAIGGLTFRHCENLMSIETAEDNAHFCSVDGVLFSKDKTLLVKYPAGRQGAYTITDGVVTIGEHAVENCRGLTSVSIPNGVTAIKALAFDGCTGLTSLTIPNSVLSIGYAFDDCPDLMTITCLAPVPPEGCPSMLLDNKLGKKNYLYVPKESIAAYTAAIAADDVWKRYRKKDFERIRAIGG